MDWYLIYTKPRQETVALLHLQRQGYVCYMPALPVEKVRHRSLQQVVVPLFPRYLFVQLGSDRLDKSWAPIRSTHGVMHIVRFGAQPARVKTELIEWLRQQEIALSPTPQTAFTPGQKLVVTNGPFTGIEGIFRMHDGEQRVMLLIQWMHRPVQITARPDQVKATDA
jgi:transcriptional antiterminator RfaH